MEKKKRKSIDLSPEAYRKLGVMAINEDMLVKAMIEKLLERCAYTGLTYMELETKLQKLTK